MTTVTGVVPRRGMSPQRLRWGSNGGTDHVA